MNSLHIAIAFVSGAAIGGFVAWQALKTKYERIAEEEINSVKEMYSKKNYDQLKENIDTYERLVKEYKTNESDCKDIKPKMRKKEREDYNDMNEPYVIDPDRFGDIDDYDTDTLYYYSDGILADDQNNIIDDIDDVIGLDALEEFEDCDGDSIYVRNERLETDYEILRDNRTFAEAMEG